eukprot:269609_1
MAIKRICSSTILIVLLSATNTLSSAAINETFHCLHYHENKIDIPLNQTNTAVTIYQQIPAIITITTLTSYLPSLLRPLFLLLSLSSISNAQYIDCIGNNKCYSDTIHCNSTTDIDCVIDCIGNDACYATVINGTGEGNLVINAQKDWALYGSFVYCPKNKNCTINCNGSWACNYVYFIGDTGTKLFIKASGTEVLAFSIVECSLDSISGPAYSNDAICSVFAQGKYDGMLDFLIIYASESLNNVKLICDTESDTDCYADYAKPQLFCTDTLNVSCFMEQKMNQTGFSCMNPTDICNDYRFPTQLPSTTPTMEPTTMEPTFSPTQYDPQNDPPHTLYVSNNGCDTGVCDTEYFDLTSHCNLNWFNTLDGYNECCDIYNSTAIPVVTTSASSANCSSNNTVIINNTDTVASVIANVYDYGVAGTKILCFQIETPFICYKPTIIKVEYESINYENGPEYDDYLNISYKNKYNYMNQIPCSGGTSAACGNFLECPINVQPPEEAWTVTEGPYIFYLINGKGVGPFCGAFNEERSMHVKLSIQCSLIPSTCRSFDYGWKCLHGDVGCDTVSYNGNGRIKLDIGTFYFDDTFYIKNKQIKIEGKGYNNTILKHYVQNNH